MDDRRLKIFKISEETVASLFRVHGKAFRVIMPQWPADATMRGVAHLYECGCFGVRVHSLSFDIVPEGHYIPIEEQQASIEVLDIAADAPRLLEVLRNLLAYAEIPQSWDRIDEAEQAFTEAHELLEKHGG
jgi:hypothetical protein